MNAVSTITDYLNLVAGMRGVHPQGFLCAEAFVLKHGRLFDKTIKAPKKASRTVKECFCNAFRLMMDDESLVYCEGFATSIIPTNHAWCVTAKGEVIDPTWERFEGEKQYYGVPFKREFVISTALARKVYGVMDDYERRFPLLAGKYEPEEFLHVLGKE